MSTAINLVIRIGAKDSASDDYPVELQLEDKPVAVAKMHLNTQSLLMHEHAADAHAYGMEMYTALVTGDVATAYQRIISEAGEAQTIRVQLIIHPDAHELHALPWERLFNVFHNIDVPLAASSQTPFSRFLICDAGDDQSATADYPLHLLLAVANPIGLKDTDQLDVTGEVTAIADLLAKQRGWVEATVLPGRTGLPEPLQTRLQNEGWTIVNGVTSWENIQQNLTEKHIVHILAHGQTAKEGATDTTYLLLEDKGAPDKAPGTINRVADTMIRDGLSHVTPRPQLVFLAACESAKRAEGATNPFVGLAPKLVEIGVPAVVAMQDSVPVSLAHTLAVDFYKRLFKHGLVDLALNEARAPQYKPTEFDWAIPVLFLRKKDGRLLVRPETTVDVLSDISRLPADDPDRDSFETKLQYFVDRSDEMVQFNKMVGARLNKHVLHVRGVEGMGKTSLIRRFALWCHAHGILERTVDFAHYLPSESYLTVLNELTLSQHQAIFAEYYKVLEDAKTTGPEGAFDVDSQRKITKSFVSCLHNLPPSTSVIYFIDNVPDPHPFFDPTAGAAVPTIHLWLWRILLPLFGDLGCPPGVAIVIAGVESQAAAPTSDLSNAADDFVQPAELSIFTIKDFIECCRVHRITYPDEELTRIYTRFLRQVDNLRVTRERAFSPASLSVTIDALVEEQNPEGGN